MTKKFLLTSLATIVVLFILNAIFFAAFLSDFFQNHPAVSSEFMKQLYRPEDQLIGWAVVLCSITIGIMITLVMKWSGARNFVAGLKSAFMFSLLFLITVDMGLYSTTNNFTLAGAIADITCSTTALTIGGAFAAWMLGKGNVEPR